MDPMVQIVTRRVLQVRRSCCKRKESEQKFKRMLGKYAVKYKKGDEWLKWYHDSTGQEDEGPSQYPVEQSNRLDRLG